MHKDIETAKARAEAVEREKFERRENLQARAVRRGGEGIASQSAPSLGMGDDILGFGAKANDQAGTGVGCG